ncbi:hypothetical protein HYR99_14520 [Candidatus Poribacteria bacterium]|nr:hypothetical protein [Candidatus Poribacteria bacterium]
MTQTKELICRLERSLTDHAWEQCAEICFSLLYGIPSDTQVRLACTMISRYLPIFKARWPAITWPEHILNGMEQWIEQFGREVPEEPDAVNPADAAFLFCFDALLLALVYRTHHAILTSSCVAAINSAITARAANVWSADDPEAVKMWEAHGYCPGRSLVENSAAVAVTEGEWRVVAKWLSDEEGKTLPNEVNLDEVEQALAHWKQHEMLLMMPELKGLSGTIAPVQTSEVSKTSEV